MVSLPYHQPRKRGVGGFALVSAAVILTLALLVAPAVATSSGPECAPLFPDGPFQIDPDCVDPLYNKPVIDSESNQTWPGTHHRVSGHFADTSIRFNFYFPPKDAWDGRFFQWAYPTHSENATDETIGFNLESRAYAVQVTGENGYRAEAAAAKLSREVAQRHYGDDDAPRRIYGYLYGGSGGSAQTVGAIENTRGVWDGAVAMVIAIPVSVIANPSARAMAGFLLRDKMDAIEEALRPGGSGDPYAQLDDVERSMLREVTRMGIPVRTWEDFASVANSSTLSLLAGAVVGESGLDPAYVDDFWSDPGYLGSEKSALGDMFRDAVVDYDATVERIEFGEETNTPSAVVLDVVPPEAAIDVYGYELSVYGPNGTVTGTLGCTLDQAKRVAAFDDLVVAGNNDADLLETLAPGSRLHVSNRESLAMRAYYRHQVPERDGFYGFDQFRDPADGSPIFPRREVDASKSMSESAAGGGNHTGHIRGKLVVVQNLLDSDAFPWHADWYARQVEEALGAEGTRNNFRLWYNDNVDHYYQGVDEERSNFVVPYDGIYEQALRDVSAWVEEGTPAPGSTRYTVVADDNSVMLPGDADERAGIQPTVRLTVEGESESVGAGGEGFEVEAEPGQVLFFRAAVGVPPGTGEVVSVEWDFLGARHFSEGVVPEPAPNGTGTVTAEASFTYETPGRYIAVVRVASQREGDRSTPFARVMNLARVAVTVR